MSEILLASDSDSRTETQQMMGQKKKRSSSGGAGNHAWNILSRGIASICLISALLFLLQGCVGPGLEVVDLTSRAEYVCANDRVLRVERSADKRMANVMLSGQELLLIRAQSAAQEKYSDGTHYLYLQDQRAMLERDGQVLYGPCVSARVLPKTIQTYEERAVPE